MRILHVLALALLACTLAIAAEEPTFDVVSIKVAGPDARPAAITGGPGTNDPAHFRAPVVFVPTLLTKAFGVGTDQISGPSWLRDTSMANGYSIDASMPATTTREQFRKMLQSMLAGRFHLVVHHETRNAAGYELLVDKGGPKLKESVIADDAPAANDKAAFQNAAKGSDGFPVLPGARTMNTLHGDGKSQTKYQERTMAEFVSNMGFLIGSSQGKSVLDGYLQPHVADKTGLTGKYTFILEYYDAGTAARARSLPRPGGTQSPAAADPDDSGPTIFEALQKQLGLRLDKKADIPVDIIVINTIDKVPTAN